MSERIEIISAENAERLEEVGLELAETYKVAFAGPPWFEVSKCSSSKCEVEFSPSQPGGECSQCGGILQEAYTTQELVTGWQYQLQSDSAMFEVAYEDDYPQRATLARPTTPEELFARKYREVPAMEPVLARILPAELVWIEDTFANRQRVSSGNLRERGITLDKVSAFYGAKVIATRTLAKSIVAATLRDKKTNTRAYIGTERAGESIINTAFGNPGYELPTVPDRRTLLVIQDRLDL